MKSKLHNLIEIENKVFITNISLRLVIGWWYVLTLHRGSNSL